MFWLVQDAEKEFAALQKEPLLKGAVCGLLHGRMSGEEKAAALSQFASGHIQVLISTTVVEVSCMGYYEWSCCVPRTVIALFLSCAEQVGVETLLAAFVGTLHQQQCA